MKLLTYKHTYIVCNHGKYIINSMNLAKALLKRLLFTQRIIVFATIRKVQIPKTTNTARPSNKNINSPTKTRIEIIISIKHKILALFSF